MQPRALIAAAPEKLRGRLGEGVAERLVAIVVKRVTAAHPELPFSDAFLAFVGSRLSEQAVEQDLEPLFLEDLALAFGCLEALPVFLDRFDRLVLHPILQRLRTDSDSAQRVREKLWVGRRLEDYAGRGPLIAWSRMVVRRQVINDGRGGLPIAEGHPEDVQPEDALLALVGRNPELEVLKTDARGALAAALRRALKTIKPELLELLQLHHIQELPHGEIGKRLGVPRSTVAFRLEKARAQLLELTREGLREHLGDRRSDVDSLIRAVDGNWDLSLSMLRPKL